MLAILEQFRTTSTVFYSTHILDDVQRVSDAVCILKGGRVVRQGPLAEVLAAGSESVFVVVVDGDVQSARAALQQQPWVQRVDVGAGGPTTATLRIAVSDADAAAARLQRVLLADEDLVIKEFSRPVATLEDVFVDLVEGGQADG